jgi:hypothetical protein
MLGMAACSGSQPQGSGNSTPTAGAGSETAADPAGTPNPVERTGSPSQDPLAAAPLGKAGCRPVSPVATTSADFLETRLTPDGLDGWALLFEEPPWPPGKEVKVVWRVSGTGEIALIARGPDRMKVRPSFGPESHPASNYRRPGDEWGSGFILPSAGCWELTAKRADGSASLFVLVEKPDA